MAIDPTYLPEDPKVLQRRVLDLITQLDRESAEWSKIETLLRELLDARRNCKSEQISPDQLALFAAAFEAWQAEAESCGPLARKQASATNTSPRKLTVIEDVCKKYACACIVKTTTKPSQPIEKSMAGTSLLAQVIVAKNVDHLPPHRQEKIFTPEGRQ